MTIEDRIYGTYQISNPVVVRLIRSRPFQRLKKINQFGIPDIYYHLKNYTRYEHSLGVFLLLQNAGASEEEQIAGLLHDISHTAFSHVVDWVFGSGKTEKYQDNQHEKFITQTAIASILRKYGFTPEKIAGHKKFRLLDNSLPNICADRLDYAFREIPLPIAKYCFKHLRIFEQRFAFTSKKAAQLFATEFLKRQNEHWGGEEGVIRYKIFALALRRGLKVKAISRKDFWQHDEFVIKKLARSSDSQLLHLLGLLRRKEVVSLPKGQEVAFKKFRYVDPEFIYHSKVKKLTSADPKFKDFVKKSRVMNKSGITIPLV